MSVLVDTSVWIDHFRKSEPYLVDLLETDLIVCHPFVVGELACGHLNNRHEILNLLEGLHQLRKIEDSELLFFIDQQQLTGKGLGLIDMHLLASAKLDGAKIWTKDKKLNAIVQTMDLTP